MNLRDLKELLDEETPAQVKHCVRSVGKKTGSLNRAFAICVAAGQKHGTLKKGTIEPTGKGKKADAAKKKDPDHDSKVSDYETMLAKARKEDVMPSLRSDMLQLLGETDQETFQTRRDAGPTSTGVTNKPAKKTPIDKKPPPNVQGSGDEGEASATATPKNSPAKKAPMKAGVKPPNVTGSGSAVENAKREARIYAGIDNRYGIKPGDIAPEPEEESYLSTIEEDVSEDPILKIAREAMRSPFRSHPFE